MFYNHSFLKSIDMYRSDKQLENHLNKKSSQNNLQVVFIHLHPKNSFSFWSNGIFRYTNSLPVFIFNDRKTHNIQHRPIRIIHLSDSQGNRTRLMIKRVSFRLSSILIWILSTYAWGTFQKIRRERERERERGREKAREMKRCWQV